MSYCDHCHKVSHATASAAMRATKSVSSRGGKSGRAYRCPFGNWHMTSGMHEFRAEVKTRAYHDKKHSCCR